MKLSKTEKTKPETREDRYARELCATLDAMGCILGKMELRRIRQAFEKHYREVFAAVYRVPGYDLKVLEPLACLEDGPLDPDASDSTPMYNGGFPTLGQVRDAREALEIAKSEKDGRISAHELATCLEELVEAIWDGQLEANGAEYFTDPARVLIAKAKGETK